MFIKKDGFPFHQFVGDNTLIVDSNRLSDTISYINRMKISHVFLSNIFYKQSELNFLSECPSVSEVTIQSGAISDCSGLYRMDNLIKLSVPDKFVDIDMSKLPKLQEFRGRINVAKNIDKCVGLKQLWTYGNFLNKNLVHLQDLYELEVLGITQGNITSLDGIDGLRNLIKLELNYLKNLTDISQIKYVSDTIKAIEIENCPCISGYDIIGNLHNVDTLYIKKCSPIHSISFINYMKKLKTFSFVGTTIEDGDLTPCLKLEFVYFNNKKHYSHTLKQVNPDWVRKQKNTNKLPTKICLLNNEEIETGFFVSLFVIKENNEIICETKDNRYDNTDFKYYTYSSENNGFSDEKGDCLPNAIINNNGFIKALHQASII